MTCVLRAAHPRDLEVEGVFVIPPSEGKSGKSGLQFSPSMRLCVSARMAAADEARAYRAWCHSKGGG